MVNPKRRNGCSTKCATSCGCAGLRCAQNVPATTGYPTPAAASHRRARRARPTSRGRAGPPGQPFVAASGAWPEQLTGNGERTRLGCRGWRPRQPLLRTRSSPRATAALGRNGRACVNGRRGRRRSDSGRRAWQWRPTRIGAVCASLRRSCVKSRRGRRRSDSSQAPSLFAL